MCDEVMNVLAFPMSDGIFTFPEENETRRKRGLLLSREGFLFCGVGGEFKEGEDGIDKRGGYRLGLFGFITRMRR